MAADNSKKVPPVFEVVAATDGCVIQRDGVGINTPAGILLTLPTKALAEKIADEWRAQTDKLKPETMPYMQLAATALDIIAKKREQVATALAAYAESDLLCHRAEEPPELVEQQEKIWQPWLDWAAEHHKARLNVGQGVMPVTQPVASLASLREVVTAYDHFHLAGLQQAVGVTGSLILGLALVEGRATAADLFEASELDALHQMKKWGEDPVTTARHESARRELDIAEKWFSLLNK
jgi:chaperone required for assembly of F1-ATPase